MSFAFEFAMQRISQRPDEVGQKLLYEIKEQKLIKLLTKSDGNDEQHFRNKLKSFLGKILVPSLSHTCKKNFIFHFDRMVN